MSLTGKVGRREARHSNQASEQFAADKRYFSDTVSKSSSVNIKVTDEKPRANCKMRTSFGEEQYAAIAVSDGDCILLRHVKGKAYQDALDREIACRSFKIVGSGKKTKRQPDPTPLNRQTVSFMQWHSEVFSEHATADEILDLMTHLSRRFAALTGWQILAANLHTGSHVFHIDLETAERSRGGIILPTALKGTWTCGDGASIDLRYDTLGFPVDPEKLEEEKRHVAKNEAKPKFLWHRDLEIGKSLDEWVEQWARRRGLVDELKRHRKRFEDAAREKVQLAIRLRNEVRKAKKKASLDKTLENKAEAKKRLM